MPEVKICGLTRAVDASLAARLGADYVGVVFAESPRRVDPERARLVFADLPPAGVRRAGVFSRRPPGEVLEIARSVALDVVQLHDDFSADEITAIAEQFDGEVWTVVRVGPAGIPPERGWLFSAAGGVVLDALSRRGLGGTGESFSWTAVAADVAARRGAARLIVAGGLRAENVADAIVALRPDVVDVSSGVESAPGVKDRERLEAFFAAARPPAPGRDRE